jgi:hypothetical protein
MEVKSHGRSVRHFIAGEGGQVPRFRQLVLLVKQSESEEVMMIKNTSLRHGLQDFAYLN